MINDNPNIFKNKYFKKESNNLFADMSNFYHI